MPKNKGRPRAGPRRWPVAPSVSKMEGPFLAWLFAHDSHVFIISAGKGGKNRRRGKNESEEKRELIFKEDGQGERMAFMLSRLVMAEVLSDRCK